LKIRNKITIWIVGAGLCVSLIFSGFIYIEIAEESFELIDRELSDKVADIGYYGKQAGDMTDFIHALESLPSIKHYWVRLFNGGQRPVWESSVARKIDIIFPDNTKPFTVRTGVPAGDIYTDLEAKEKLAFRVIRSSIQIRQTPYDLLVGIPIENPVTDIMELILIIAAGFIASTVILFAISYWLSGRILKPINEINHLAGIISERTLTQRIPLRKSRDELYYLSETLNSMFDRLQFSFDRQKQFLADASHELKSPVALLRLKTEEYLQNEDLTEEHKAQLAGLSEQLHRMSRLINNLLDLSALEHTDIQLQYKEILLKELMMSVLDDFAEAFHARHLAVSNKLPEELKIHGDFDQLRRAIVNLVDNAVKYNVDFGKIEIYGCFNDSRVHVYIRNTGKGIPEADLPFIFDQFYRIEKSRSSELGGVGLGLTIVKRIVELHGGKIEVYSEPGNWTQVDFLFPAI